MDQLLIEYLKSGKAWLLVGSGASNAMGYPDWAGLGHLVVDHAKYEMSAQDAEKLEKAMTRRTLPEFFDEAQALFGWERLLQILRTELKPTTEGKIYEIIARWPIPVYMTTNYDDEISSHLAKVGEAYKTYFNSESDLALLIPGFNGAIIKLHGDLTSQRGLILTKKQYRSIQTSKVWEYWRVKMISVFQMIPVVIIGHSLTDKNIIHVLEAAKMGAGVSQPVLWIAPDVPYEERRIYLEKYRIRVISYPNLQGDHQSLVRLIETIDAFMPRRLTVHLQQQIADISYSPLKDSAAAPGFFVFNKLMSGGQVEKIRVDILVSVIESAIPRLEELESFEMQEALETAGWPSDVKLDSALCEAIAEAATTQGILEQAGASKFKLGQSAKKKLQ